MAILTSYFSKRHKQSYNLKDAVLSLSKGKCLSDCPVYDLWIFKNGQVIYKGIENVEKPGTHRMFISSEAIKHINQLLSNLMPEDIGSTRERKKPLTLLKFKGKRIVYQSSRVSGYLMELDNLLQSIVKSI